MNRLVLDTHDHVRAKDTIDLEGIAADRKILKRLGQCGEGCGDIAFTPIHAQGL